MIEKINGGLGATPRIGQVSLAYLEGIQRRDVEARVRVVRPEMDAYSPFAASRYPVASLAQHRFIGISGTSFAELQMNEPQC